MLDENCLKMRFLRAMVRLLADASPNWNTCKLEYIRISIILFVQFNVKTKQNKKGGDCCSYLPSSAPIHMVLFLLSCRMLAISSELSSALNKAAELAAFSSLWPRPRCCCCCCCCASSPSAAAAAAAAAAALSSSSELS